MMYRKITGNLIAALLLPIVIKTWEWKGIYRAIVYQQYEFYDFKINSLKDYLAVIFEGSYPWVPLISLLLIFVPFQLIKNYYQKKGIRLSFITKIVILSSITVCVIVFFGTFSNIWAVPWYHNFIYIAYAIGFGLFFTTLLYFLVDRYAERQQVDKKSQDPTGSK